MRIRVKTTALLGKLEAHRQTLTASHERDAKAFPAAEARYRAAVEDALLKQLARIRDGRPLPIASTAYVGSKKTYGVLVAVAGERPHKPPKPSTARLDARIRALRIASDEVMSIDPDEWKEWL